MSGIGVGVSQTMPMSYEAGIRPTKDMPLSAGPVPWFATATLARFWSRKFPEST